MEHPLEVYQIFFVSLSNPNRLQIINSLRKGKKNVGEICKATGFEQTMVSHNLKRLERCSMVIAEKKGKYRYYSLNKETIKPLMKFIDDHINRHCCKLLGKKQK